MFQSKTVFIVGAGASAEAKMPLGQDLVEQIANVLPTYVDDFERKFVGDRQVYQVIRHLVQSDESWANNQLIGTAREIAAAMAIAPSIDNFMHTHRNDREVILLGKLGIARAIQLAERNSLLRPNGEHEQFDLKDLEGSWYPSLARLLFTDVPSEHSNYAFQNVSFIVFNYDRCLQAYLLRTIQAYFRVSINIAKDFLKDVSFIHPYGSLGSILNNDEKNRVPFGTSNLDLMDAARRIQTFTESVQLAPTIKHLIYDADTLVFLGSAFHPQNLAILDPDADLFLERGFKKRIFGTSKGLSASDCEVVRNQLSTLIVGHSYSKDFGEWIFLNEGTCSDLFSTYWRSLTAPAIGLLQ